MVSSKHYSFWDCFSIIIFALCSFISKAQIEPAEIYGGVGYYRHTGLKDNAYVDFRTGIQLFSYKFISPEIDFTYYFGDNEVVKARDLETDFPTSVLKTNFRGSILGIAPKLFIGDSELRFVFIPKYHFGKIKAEGFLTTTNSITLSQEITSKINFWSFSVGLEGELGNERLKLGFYLIYTGFNAGKSINQISLTSSDFEDSNIDTSTLGMTLRISYGLWVKKEKN